MPIKCRKLIFFDVVFCLILNEKHLFVFFLFSFSEVIRLTL